MNPHYSNTPLLQHSSTPKVRDRLTRAICNLHSLKQMPRPFLIPLVTLLVLFSVAFLNGCASTTTTTVGVTTNEAPPFHELGR
jgi:hypothetical protein